MRDRKKRTMSDWKTFSELRPIHQDISELGYKKEYIEKNNLSEIKYFNWSNSVTGVVCYYEPLEVMAEGDKIFWRYNENHVHRDIPEVFVTRFGTFNNHNHGEFTSWLEIDEDVVRTKRGKKINNLFRRNDFSVEGNYCDMFDCGEYVYAVSNLMHMGMGDFKMIRIDKNLGVVTVYENYSNADHMQLEYQGRYKNADGYGVVVSGICELENFGGKSEIQDVTILFQIDENGNCYISNEWDGYISSSNSMVTDENYIYFGQNKMITRLNILTGDMDFFTNKTCEEMAALAGVW